MLFHIHQVYWVNFHDAFVSQVDSIVNIVLGVSNHLVLFHIHQVYWVNFHNAFVSQVDSIVNIVLQGRYQTFTGVSSVSVLSSPFPFFS